MTARRCWLSGTRTMAQRSYGTVRVCVMLTGVCYCCSRFRSADGLLSLNSINATCYDYIACIKYMINCSDPGTGAPRGTSPAAGRGLGQVVT